MAAAEDPTASGLEPELTASATTSHRLPRPRPAGSIRYASEAASELLKSDREALIGLPVTELVVDQDQPMVQSAYTTLLHTTGARTVVATTRPRFGGRVVEAEFHTRGTDIDHKIVTVVLTDHTEEPELVRMATRDALTGLANRTKVLGTIAGLLLDPDPVFSVVYIDLDDLKSINDNHGHETGDLALIAVGERLRELVRPADLVGRMSGDEFVIVCPGLRGSGLMRFVQRVGETATEPAWCSRRTGARRALERQRRRRHRVRRRHHLLAAAPGRRGDVRRQAPPGRAATRPAAVSEHQR